MRRRKGHSIRRSLRQIVSLLCAIILIAGGLYIASRLVQRIRVSEDTEKYASLYLSGTEAPDATVVPAATDEPAGSGSMAETEAPGADPALLPDSVPAQDPAAEAVTPEPSVIPETTAAPEPSGDPEPAVAQGSASPTAMVQRSPSPSPASDAAAGVSAAAASAENVDALPDVEAPVPRSEPQEVTETAVPEDAAAEETTEPEQPNEEPVRAPDRTLTPGEADAAAEAEEAGGTPGTISGPEEPASESGAPAVTASPEDMTEAPVVTAGPEEETEEPAVTAGLEEETEGDMSVPEPSPMPGEAGTAMPAEETADDAIIDRLPTPPPVQGSFEKLLSINAETVAFLQISNTIALPVVQRFNDNDYYLDHSFAGSESSAGTAFLDGMNRLFPLDDCLIVYGHNMRDDTMFGRLDEFKDPSFLKEHSLVSFDTIYENGQYVPVAVFSASMEPGSNDYFEVRRFLFDSEEAFDGFLDEIRSRSLLDIPVDAEYGDSMLMLVTCDYAHDDGRFVVVLRRIRDGEDAQSLVDAINAME